jgi:dihydrofolate reductase
MRKVIVSVHTTLDGCMSGPIGDLDNLDWLYPRVEELSEDVLDLLKTWDTILMGRVTYEGLAQYWPTATGEFADQMNTTPKIVFSKTPMKVEWGKWDNISLIHENVAEEVKKMKQQPGQDMVIFASSKLVQSFTNLGLIDEYKILVHPVILGSGKRLFEDIEDRHNLKLVNTKTYKGEAVLLDYQPTK